MSTEQNKKIVIGMLENLSRGNMAGVLEALAENSTWWIVGNHPLISGTKTKQEVSESFKNFDSFFPKGMKITVDNAIAEGDYVAVEGRSYGETRIGKIYQNRYHWLFEVRDGKVQVVREYMDTLHAKEAILGE